MQSPSNVSPASCLMSGWPFAAVAAAVALVYMATGSLFTDDVFDELWWCLGGRMCLSGSSSPAPQAPGATALAAV